MEPCENRPKRPKTQNSIGKILTRIFCDACCIILIDCLKTGKIVTRVYYAAILECLNNEIKKKWPHMANNVVLFHQDNAAHTSIKVVGKLNEFK